MVALEGRVHFVFTFDRDTLDPEKYILSNKMSNFL